MALYQAREHPDRRSVLCAGTASATGLLATRTSPSPVDSNASTIDEIIAELETTDVAERSGRAMDHEAEDAFERLRVGGYM